MSAIVIASHNDRRVAAAIRAICGAVHLREAAHLAHELLRLKAAHTLPTARLRRHLVAGLEKVAH